MQLVSVNLTSRSNADCVLEQNHVHKWCRWACGDVSRIMILIWTSERLTRSARFVIEYAKHVAPHLKIIASAGSPEKMDILKKVGADVAINYKTQDLESVLREHGPIDM